MASKMIATFCTLAVSLATPAKASSTFISFAAKMVSSQAAAEEPETDSDEDPGSGKKGKKGGGDQCKKAKDTAKSACTDGKSTAGMDQQTGQQFMMAMMAAMAAGSALQSGEGGAGQMLACSLMGPLLANLMTANGMKGDACEKSVKKCDEACGSKSAKGKDGGESGCDYGGKADDAIMQALSMGAALASVMACMSGTGRSAAASTTPTPTPVPTCDDPKTAMTDISCKCDVAKNPKANPLDPICGKPQGLGAVMGLSGEARPGAPISALDDLNAGGTIGEGMIGKPSKGNGDGTSGGGGGAPSASGQLQALNQDRGPGGPGGKDINTSIITGQTGANGLVPSGGGGGSGGASPAGSSSGSSLADRFNLSKFMPKKDFMQRGVAGMSVPAVDGMTGPNGPSIWEKSSSRYQDEDSKGRWVRGPTLTPRPSGSNEAPSALQRQLTAPKKK